MAQAYQHLRARMAPAAQAAAAAQARTLLATMPAPVPPCGAALCARLTPWAHGMWCRNGVESSRRVCSLVLPPGGQGEVLP